MKYNGYFIGAITAACIFCAAFARAEEKKEAQPRDRAEKAMKLASDTAQKAAIARDMSINAVINALAARDDLEAELLKAMKANDKKQMSSIKKSLGTAAKGAEEAREMAEKIIEYAAESLSAAESAKEHAKRVLDEKTEGDVEPVLRKAEELCVISQKSAGKAESLVEALKKKWLIQPAKPAAATPTPPAPAPVVEEKK